MRVASAEGASGWVRRCCLCSAAESERRKAHQEVPLRLICIGAEEDGRTFLYGGALPIRMNRFVVEPGQAFWMDASAEGSTFTVASHPLVGDPEVLFLYKEGDSIAQLPIWRRPTAQGDLEGDAAAMARLAGRISGYIDEQAREWGLGNAWNMSLASCLFAREMNCVRGKEPRAPTPEMRLKAADPPKAEYEDAVIIIGGQPRNCAAVWRTVRSRTLQADQDVDGISVATYDEILQWALGEDEIAELRAIRERHGYWPKVEASLQAAATQE
jgi:hypothetical protein